MAEENGRVVRRHKQRSDDGKGLRRLIAEKRFRLPVGVSGPEAEQRFLLIERLWRDNEAFCRKIHRETQWTEIALWAAESIRHGTPRIPMPPIDDILASYGESPWRSAFGSSSTDSPTRRFKPGILQQSMGLSGMKSGRFLTASLIRFHR